MMIYELNARFDSRKSFYGKAHIHETPKFLNLVSYDTHILRLNKNTGAIEFFDLKKWMFSQTTRRHINEFFKQFTNEKPKSKKELLKMANII